MDWHSAEYPSSHSRIRGIYDDHLEPVFGNTAMHDITPASVERWKAHRRTEGAAPATISKELRTLKAMLNCAVRWELLPVNRISGVEGPQDHESKPPPFYTPQQLQEIYARAKKHGAVWQFMANTGVRRAEMMQARRSHIEDGRLKVLSTNKARTKSRKWRLVPLSPGALAALPELGSDYLAPRIHPNSLSRAFRIDSGGGSIHRLRHTFCSQLVMNGIDLRTVQELAGHAGFNTTLIYAHLAPGHLDAAVEGLEL